MKLKLAMALGAAALAMGTAANAAIYVKIPDIDGESETRKDSGEAHLDYLVITLNNATGTQENRTTPFETEDIGAKAAGDDHSAGDEHEIEYDVAAGALHAQGQHEAAHVLQQRTGSGAAASADGHKDWIDIMSWSQPVAAEPAVGRGASTVIRARTVSTAVAPRDAASGRATGKRQHRPFVATKPIDKASPLRVPVEPGPGSLTLAQAMEGCSVGATYPHVLVGDDSVGREVKLHKVTVAECSREHVSFNYEKISS